jgi:hypothetical protein
MQADTRVTEGRIRGERSGHAKGARVRAGSGFRHGGPLTQRWREMVGIDRQAEPFP